jgi:peroxiredoxin family protein
MMKLAKEDLHGGITSMPAEEFLQQVADSQINIFA